MTMNTERFHRVTRDDPQRSGECTDIPGAYGRGIDNAPKTPAADKALYAIGVAVVIGFALAKLFPHLFR